MRRLLNSKYNFFFFFYRFCNKKKTANTVWGPWCRTVLWTPNTDNSVTLRAHPLFYISSVYDTALFHKWLDLQLHFERNGNISSGTLIGLTENAQHASIKHHKQMHPILRRYTVLKATNYQLLNLLKGVREHGGLQTALQWTGSQAASAIWFMGRDANQ